MSESVTQASEAKTKAGPTREQIVYKNMKKLLDQGAFEDGNKPVVRVSELSDGIRADIAKALARLSQETGKILEVDLKQKEKVEATSWDEIVATDHAMRAVKAAGSDEFLPDNDTIGKAETKPEMAAETGTPIESKNSAYVPFRPKDARKAPDKITGDAAGDILGKYQKRPRPKMDDSSSGLGAKIMAGLNKLRGK